MSARETPARPALEPALPSSWYRSERVWEAEKERIFSREWVCAGREEQLADEPGAHRLLEVLGESIILVRNRERALRALRRPRSSLRRSPPAAPSTSTTTNRSGPRDTR